MRRVISHLLSGLKYIIAVFMIYSGIATVFTPPEETPTILGWIYEQKVLLVIFGSLFAASGFGLLLGKIFHKTRVVGVSLMSIYLYFTFFGITNWIVMGWTGGVGNLVAALITGGLYLRWKHHVWYADSDNTPRVRKTYGVRSPRG